MGKGSSVFNKIILYSCTDYSKLTSSYIASGKQLQKTENEKKKHKPSTQNTA